MAYTKPNFETIFNTTKQDLFSRFPDLDPSLQESMAEAIVSVIAAGLNGNYNFVEYVSDQVFPTTADDDSLNKWGSVVGLYRLPAGRSAGSVIFTGLSGSIVPTGSQLATNAGTLYEIDTGFTMVSATESHDVTAVDFGAAGNLSAGDTLVFSTTFAGMDSTATVGANGIINGRDRETDDEYRVRVLERFQAPPKGGTEADYVAWIKEAVGATRVWVRSWENSPDFGESTELGQVSGYFAIDDVYTNGIPTSADVITVDAYVDDRKHIGTLFNAKIPGTYDVDVVANITPFSTDLQTAVTDALDTMIVDLGQPGGTLRLSDFFNAISSVAGITGYDIISPIANVTANAGELHIPGTYTIGGL